MSERDLAQLKKLAEAATQDKWRTGGAGKVGTFAERSHVVDFGMPTSAPYAVCYSDDIETNRANAAFIAAANPSTILALLSELEQAERERDALKSCLTEAEWELANAKAVRP